MLLTRLVVSIGVLLNFFFSISDIRSSYKQSGHISKYIYVRPPPPLRQSYGRLWKLTKLPYAIVDAGKKGLKPSYYWIISVSGINRSSFNQLFYKQDSGGKIILVVVNKTEHFLGTGTLSVLTGFL